MAKLTVKTKFATVPNHLLNDKNLSFKAKGLYAYIQSKESSWDFSAERIAIQTKEGFLSVRAGLKELEQAGYLERIKTKNSSGHWEMEYILHLLPCNINPMLQKPTLGNPTLVFPTVELPTVENHTNNSKQDYSKKEYSNTINSKGEQVFNENLFSPPPEVKQSTPKPGAKPNPDLQYPFPSVEFKTAWEDWIEYKYSQHKDRYKELKTEQNAVNQLMIKANNLETNAIRIIYSSMGNLYKGLYDSGPTFTKQTLHQSNFKLPSPDHMTKEQLDAAYDFNPVTHGKTTT